MKSCALVSLLSVNDPERNTLEASLITEFRVGAAVERKAVEV